MGCGKYKTRPVQQQLAHPFRISNRGLDAVDRYLTLNDQAHPLEQIYLAEARPKIEGSLNQLWIIEHDEKDGLYRIRIHNDNLYLNLTKSKKINEYVIELCPFQDGSSQLWSFELGEHRRFFIKNDRFTKQALYLQSAEVETLKEEYKNIFVCRPKASHERRYLQNWKLSPTTPTINNKQIKLNAVSQNQRSIPLFKGKIYTKTSSEYWDKTDQYASSSYPPSHMSPHMIAYPKDVEDIKLIISLAKQQGKKVVARSGGHQYSGLSSGGSGTIVVSLDSFNDLKLSPDGLVEIGPCVPLKTASKQLRDWKLSVPHGVCPLVNIGGHGQTGGYGHFTRSFGLLIDYIEAFEIVLANGEHRKVTRPKAANTPQEKQNLQLFRGVMGGNAGSFGIVTKYYIRPIKDSDHPKSYSISKVRLYNKQLLKSVLKQYQVWSKLIAQGKDQSIKGLDLLFSITQFQIELVGVKWTVMSLSGLYSDPDGKVPYKGQFKNIFDIFSKGQALDQSLINVFQDLANGEAPLSKIAEDYVIKYPLVTKTGREFNLPYKKRGNVTAGVLTDAFIDHFIDITDRVVSPKEKSLNLVIQMMAGGGQYREKGKRQIGGVTLTSVPLRNMSHSFSFDIFYDDKQEGNAESQAEFYQGQMQKIVEKEYSAPLGEKLFFWTSYGDLDMTKSSVVTRFYDSKEQYEQLQRLKAKVDPMNVFSSPMTVKLP